MLLLDNSIFQGLTFSLAFTTVMAIVDRIIARVDRRADRETKEREVELKRITDAETSGWAEFRREQDRADRLEKMLDEQRSMIDSLRRELLEEETRRLALEVQLRVRALADGKVLAEIEDDSPEHRRGLPGPDAGGRTAGD